MQNHSRSKKLAKVCRVCLVSSADYIDFCEPFRVVADCTASACSEKQFPLTYFDCFVDVIQVMDPLDPLEEKMPQQLCRRCSNELEQCYNFQMRARESDRNLRQNQQSVMGIKQSQVSKSIQPNKHETDILEEPSICTIDESTQLNTIASGEQDFYCAACKMHFKTNNALNLHKEQHHKIFKAQAVDQNVPDICEENTLAKSTAEVIKNSKESIECSVCKRLFGVAKYTAHFNKVHKKSPNGYQCPKCTKRFAYQHQLKTHFEVHHGLRQKNVACTLCSKMFYSKKLLHTHMITHQSKEINYNCGLCGKGFKRSASLRRHMIMHQGGKEQCNECEKRFPNITELRIHMLIHTKETPFLCNICGKSFRRQGPLSYHMRKHRGEKYNCEHCGQEFSCQSSMRIHEYKHTGLPFKCPRCDEGHVTRGSLQRHLKEVHNSELTAVELRDLYNSVQNSRLQ